MALLNLRVQDFRCLADAELSLSEQNNLVVGPNAAGKTSLLESVGYLGRGRSFRGASTRELVRTGADRFVISGKASGVHRNSRLGIRNGADGLEVRVDGERSSSIAPLAENLPARSACLLPVPVPVPVPERAGRARPARFRILG